MSTPKPTQPKASAPETRTESDRDAETQRTIAREQSGRTARSIHAQASELQKKQASGFAMGPSNEPFELPAKAAHTAQYGEGASKFYAGKRGSETVATYRLGPEQRDEVLLLEEEAQNDLDAVLFKLVSQRDTATAELERVRSENKRLIRERETGWGDIVQQRDDWQATAMKLSKQVMEQTSKLQDALEANRQTEGLLGRAEQQRDGLLAALRQCLRDTPDKWDAEAMWNLVADSEGRAS